MSPKKPTGAEAVCAALKGLGFDTLFGLPGTQTVPLFEALRRSGLRTVLTTSEAAAVFAAGGYFRSSGKIAAVSTIPGPGFTNALTGLAEAKHDSAGLILLVPRSTSHANRRFRLQALDLPKLAASVVKRSLHINRPDQVGVTMAEAYAIARFGEPGPVLVEIDETALAESGPFEMVTPAAPVFDVGDTLISEIADRLKSARHPLLFCGQGAAPAAAAIQTLAGQATIPVVTTGSGRGVIAEDHPLSLRYDFSGGARRELNGLIEQCDLVMAVGCKFTHNGGAGYSLKIDTEKLIHIDASAEVLGANYPACIQLQCEAGIFLEKLISALEPMTASQWTDEEIKQWKSKLAAEMASVLPHVPPLNDVTSADVADLFRALRNRLPRETILVTDSGYHQVLARASWEVWSPRGLLAPADFQSVGFGLPAAIGGALACPDRPVLAVIGDGGLVMSGMELLTAVRENLPLTVLLLNDGSLGQIRMEQLRAYGHDHATRLLGPDTALWCQSVGVNYLRLDGDLEGSLGQALTAGGVTLIEADTSDSPQLRRIQRKGLIKAKAGRILGRGLTARLKRMLGGR